MKVTSLDTDGSPIRSSLQVIYDRAGQRSVRVELSDENGVCSIETEDIGECISAVVKSYQGHWTRVIECSGQDKVVSLEAVSHKQALWWRKIVGAEHKKKSNESIKVGIIDISFTGLSSLSHVLRIDIDGNDISEYNTCDDHGANVCKIIGEHGVVQTDSGIASNAQLILINVEDPFLPGTWCYENIAAAISVLVLDFGVDIVNISGGARPPSDPTHYDLVTAVLKDAVELAREAGCIIVAAAGAYGSDTIAIPACFEHVVSVGAIGLCGLAPTGTLYQSVESKAERQPEFIGNFNSLRIFHAVGASYGPQLDLVAPGIGIFLFDEEERALVEHEGTTFAAPIVAGILACALAIDQRFPYMRGLSRWEYVRELLMRACVDLGLPRDVQGRGLPRLGGFLSLGMP